MPNDLTAFKAIDVATGTEVAAFCVGRGVRFEARPNRSIPANLLYYGVLPGAGTVFPGCSPPNPLPYTYTPTRAEVGMVTVSELANDTRVGGITTYYIRTFRVYDTPAPAFTIAPCPSGSALVTVTDATYDSYTVQIGAGPSAAITRNLATVVPLPAGATSATVTGHYLANDVCEGTSTQAIAPLLPPQIPTFTRLELAAPLPSTATLTVGQLPAGYRYTLQLADASAPGGFRTVTSIPAGSTTFALPSAAAGCYRLFRDDFCGTSPAPSATIICTLSLTATSARNRNQLLLSDAGSPSTTYTVTRNGSAITTLTPVPGGLEDANVQCGTAYTYQITATQPGGGVAVSNPFTITTVSALPPAQPQLLASFNLNNAVVLTPLLATPLTAGSSLRYHRASGGQPPVTFGRVDVSGAGIRDSTDLAELRASPPCYSVDLTDVCGNVSPESASTCPSLLTASPASPDGSSAALTWTAFTGPNPAIPAIYVLQRLAADGTVLSPVPVSGNSFIDLTPPTDRQVLRYRLQISGAGLPPGTFSYSNLATVTRQLFLNIPTAFTPNGDGLNDVLEVKGKYLNNYVFVVVDRNGQEVFRGTQRSKTWDGTIRGHAPVPGAYVWRFQQTGEDGKTFTATGAVTILK
ncbi:T9SS type B sorting domain-containing protein [Hymenobacter terricola]|uniref:T9SS type B sorting domain-containing protein n=1 Tax=Hymenobacter terricola TaxID=2819236 RepID=UPI001B30A695|nr:gliding motility-associated C-terminal domain-containing protein [Hymenobacter terricola]